MGTRYRSLAVYSLLLAVATGLWLGPALGEVEQAPSVWVVLFGIAATLFVFQFGLRAPRVGLISMERVPQIGLLLVFGAPTAAAICAAASFLFPLLNRAYSQHSFKLAPIRAVHNASMTALMLLAAGAVYEALGGRLPLVGFAPADVGPLIAMALVTQALNVGLMILYFWFDRRDVRAIVTPSYALSDFIFVPAGVLAAVLYNADEPWTFGLFAGLVVVLVLSFNAIGDAMAASERGPLTRLFETPRALHGARRLDELGERILAETHALFRFDEFYLVLVDAQRKTQDVRVHERRGARLPPRSEPIDWGLFGWVIERAEPLLIEDWRDAPAAVRARAAGSVNGSASVIAVPLIDGGGVIGLLSVQHAATRVYSLADLHLMQQLGGQVAAAVADARTFEDLEDYRRRLEERVAERTQELQRASLAKERLLAALRERSVRLERESHEDALTGIANRRCFTQRLAAEMEVALAIGQPLTLAVGDLDRFKVINDRLGHRIGDLALGELARLMRAHCRPTDLVARIGGEEFALILPGMAREDAAAFCERLRAGIESHDWSLAHPSLSVTLSIGLSQWDGNGDVEELLQAADTQLYRAKRAGRNAVMG